MPGNRYSLRIGAALGANAVIAVAIVAPFFSVPMTPLDIPTAHATLPDGVIFFGQSYEGDVFVWCVERSGLVEAEGGFESLKAETIRAIRLLSPGQRFSVVRFGNDTEIFSPTPIPASWQNKLIAEGWVESTTAFGLSCMADALVESVYLSAQPLLSSGQKVVFLAGSGAPFCSGVDTSLQVLLNVTAANISTGAEIHTVHLGDDPDGTSLYRSLAQANGGTFRAVPLPVVPPPPPPPPFRRGDVDGNGAVEALADAIFFLRYRFVPGSPVPPCLVAADVNADGNVSGVLDAVLLLAFQFVPGTLPPPPPGPLECGLAPSPTPLPCGIDPECD